MYEVRCTWQNQEGGAPLLWLRPFLQSLDEVRDVRLGAHVLNALAHHPARAEVLQIHED